MGEAAALLAAMTWSATSIALTNLSARVAPAVLSGLRLGAATLIIPFILFATGQASDLAEASIWTLLGIIGSGFIGYGLGDTLYIKALAVIGMQKTFPITMALFIALTVLGGVVLLGEELTFGLPLGAVLIGVGIYLIAVPAPGEPEQPVPVMAPAEPALAAFGGLPPPPRVPRLAGREALIGYGILLAVGLLWALATLWLAAARDDVRAIAAGSIRTPAGAIALIAFTATFQRRELIMPFRDRRLLAAIAAAGIIGTAFGSLMYVYAVIEAGAARTAVLSATAPLMALPLSIIFLHEQLTRRIGAGTALCVLGIVAVVI